jgi:hypothetical protein
MQIRLTSAKEFSGATEECNTLERGSIPGKITVVVENHGNLGSVEHYEVFLEQFKEWVPLEKALSTNRLFVYKTEGNLTHFREPKNFLEFKKWEWID